MDRGFLVPTLCKWGVRFNGGRAGRGGMSDRKCFDTDRIDVLKWWKDGKNCLPESSRAKVYLRRNDIGRKCVQVFTNTIHNSMKIRILAYQKFGRKYVKNFADGIAVSEKITTFASH